MSTIRPTETHIIPTGKNEKNESPSKPASSNVLWMIRLGGVPMRVIIPPMLLANAKGIRNRPGFTSTLIARLTTIGNSRATVPVLLTKPPMAEVTSITRIKRHISLLPTSFNMLELIIFARPV